MVPLDAGWNDLGAWDAVWYVLSKDEAGNARHGDVITIDSHNTLVHAASRLVGLVGVEDLVIIETPDAVLVADKSHTQDVKHIVNSLNQEKREVHTLYIPYGEIHHLANPGTIPLEIIEVQSGSYLGEDDIVRFKDDYGRNEK
jgi:mannose-1-phosphate guanylyltransferase/mannose-6-phosphate isomerase